MMQPPPEYRPVSSGQKRLFVLSRLEGGEAPYHLTGAMSLTGEVDSARLEWAFRELVARHESLRSGFEVVDDNIVQVVYPDADLEVLIIEDSTSGLDDIVRKVARPFDLAIPPLLHVALIERAPDEHLLVMDAHHIAVDGISWNILIQELMVLYSDRRLEGKTHPVSMFTSWQNEWIGSEDAKRQRSFWQQVFEDSIPVLELPTDRPRPARQSFTGALFRFGLERELVQRLREAVRKQGVTLNMVLLAAWSLLLHRLSRQDDLVIGFPTSGRTEEEHEAIVGMLVGTSMVRLRLDNKQLFSEYLQTVKRDLLEVYRHADYPFEVLVEELQVRRDLSRNPLFDTTFVYERADDRLLTLTGLEIEPLEVEKGTAMFDIALEVTDTGGQLDACFEYSTALFDSETIERWAGYYVRILNHLLEFPDSPLGEVPLLDEQERLRLLLDFNKPGVATPYDGTVVSRFLEVVRTTPDGIALRIEGVTHSYRELHTRALEISGWLQDKGVGSGACVALLQHRSFELIASLWGVLLCGAAYLPLDPSQPGSRLGRIIEDSGCRFVLAGAQQMGLLETSDGCEWVDVATIGAGKTSKKLPAIKPGDTAYLIYTSGTTGTPKGCPITHANLMNYIGWAMGTYPGEEEGGAFPLYTSVAFDLTITSIFCTLLLGRTLEVFPDELETDEVLRRIFATGSKVDSVKLTPAHVTLLKELRLSTTPVRTVILGGESVQIEHLETLWALNREMAIYNEYGPTETTVGCTVRMLLPGEATISIGQPIANTRIYILDEQGEPVPTGVYGEIVVAGAGVFPGYHNDPARTGEKLIALLFDETGIGYRTGDLGRWTNRGELECLGRLDEQLKVKGYRIEPGEIETALTTHPKVREAVVALAGEGAEKELVGWVVLESDLTSGELHEHLAQHLPEQMIPATFHQIERVPLTVNGKRDLRRLTSEQSVRLASGDSYEAPKTAAEEKIVSVWKQVLKQERVGIHDNYFLLGGDSIKAIQIISRLAREGIQLQVRDLFDHPTIEQLARATRAILPEVDQGVVIGEVPLTAIQREFFARYPFDRAHFTQAVLLRSGEELDVPILRQTLQALQDHHDALRMRYNFRGGKVRQLTAGLNYPLALEVADLRGKPEEEEAASVMLQRLPSEINLDEGPMLRGMLLRESSEDSLLLAAHHLVVDGVSWRILVDDFNLAYRQLSRGERVQLPRKTVSFRDAAHHAQVLAVSPEVREEHKSWQEFVAIPDPPLSGFDEVEADCQRDALPVSGTLDVEETDRLKAAAKSSSLQALLLVSLGRVLSRVRKTPSLVALEGHGRDGWFESIDLSRTVGWFTTLYPVSLPVMVGEVAESLASLELALSRIPKQGGGYGLLRWLGGLEELNVRPRISFNYLGEFADATDEGPLQLEIRPLKNTIGDNYPRWHELEVEMWQRHGRLEVHLVANRNSVQESYLQELLDQLLAEIRSVAQEMTSNERTISSGIDRDERVAISAQTGFEVEEIEEIIPLAPLQEGMLFHALRDGVSTAYFEQFALHLDGPLDVARFTAAWNRLIQRHSILRTRIVHKGLSQPWQVVRRAEVVSIPVIDLTGLKEKEREKRITALLEEDRASGFDLARGPLLRATLVCEGEAQHRLLWSFHHILLDGWCMGIFFRELFTFLAQNEVTLSEAPPFSAFIRWLEGFDQETARSFWGDYLHDLPGRTTFVPISEQGSSPKPQTLAFDLDEETTKALITLAAKESATLSSVVRAAWGVLLCSNSHMEDVVFGAVSSGRPGELDGAEEMLGLFLTTLPVRIASKETNPFTILLRQVQQVALEMNRHQYLSLAEIQQVCKIEGELFDHIVAFENYPLDPESFGAEDGEGLLRIARVDSFEQTHYTFSVEVYPGERLGFRFLYDAGRVEREWVTGLHEQWVTLLTTLAQKPQSTLEELKREVRPEGEREEEHHFLQSTLDLGEEF